MPSGVGDIVVTARRREESMQNVPIAVTALSAAQLERGTVRSTEDLRNFVPGLNISGQRRDEAQFFIRGQGPGVLTTGQRNFTSVATYFAEVPAAVAGPGTFYDLQSVQVLKGPQGTLFGRNTTGGAVLFEPAHPTDENNGSVSLSYGNYDFKQVEAMVNVAPLPGVLALRLAGQVSRRDGYTTSVITGQKLDERKYEALRFSVRLTPSDRFENLTIVDYRSKDGSSGSQVIRAINPGVPLGAVPTSPALAPLLGLPAGSTVSIPLRVGGTVSVACLSAALPGCPSGPFGNAVAAFQAAYNGGNFADPANGGFYIAASTSQINAILAQQQALGARKNQVPTLQRSKGLDWGATNKTTFDLTDDITLKNIIAFRKTRKNEAQDYDGTPLSFLQNLYVDHQPWGTGSNQFTEEFQIQGKLPSLNLDYIAGYYYEHSKAGFLQDVPGITLGTQSSRRADNEDKSNALFAHLEWNADGVIGLSGGIRKTWDKRVASLRLYNAAGDCTLTVPGEVPPLAQCPLEYRAKFDALTYDITLNVKPMDRTLIYASYRRGYKSGGINLPAPAAPPPLPADAYQHFEPEKVDSYEIGLKADWAVGIPFRTNLSLFYDDYKNVQTMQSTTFQDINGNTFATSIVRNGVKAVNKGVEFETTVVPVEPLRLSGFVSYLDAAPTLSIPGVVTDGRQLTNQPKWKWGVNGSLTIPVPEHIGEVVLSADYSFTGKRLTSPQPALIDVNDSYALLNMRLDWNNALGKGIDVSAFATNLTNKTYVLGGYPITQLGFDAATYGEPRMYGVAVKFRFGDR